MLVWSRALLLGGAMLGSGAVSHLAAGGLLPHPVVMLVICAAFVALAARFVLGRASTRRIVVLVVAGQGLAHTLLSALAGHRGDGGTSSTSTSGSVVPSTALTDALPTTGDGHRVGSLMDAYQSGVPTAGAHGSPALPVEWFLHLAHHLGEQGPLMVLAHVAGAVALGLWLAVGERALWALIDLAAARVLVTVAAHRSAAALLSALRGVTAALPIPRAAPGFAPVPRLDRPATSHRGPPVLLAS